MSLIENERTKLTATEINNLALAFAVAGFVAPLVAFSFGMNTSPIVTIGTAATSVIWLAVAVALHMAARRILKALRP